MECEVRVVGDMESCFVSLPLSLIQTLQSTAPSHFLPHLLALQLRSPAHDSLWHVAWSGSASSSPSAIQVSRPFAECMGLPDGALVQVSATANLAEATAVTIEPASEDDWEVMELNADHAESAILKQIAVVHEGMRFPLWLSGRSVVTFHVLSVFPAKGAVRLVPGTEVAVAPKGRRPIEAAKPRDVASQGPRHAMALLRIQDSEEEPINTGALQGIELGISLTCVAFVHPETACKYSFHVLHPVVVVPRLPSLKTSSKVGKTDLIKTSPSTGSKETKGGIMTDTKDSRKLFVRLLFSESASKGHIMLPQPLRLYIGEGCGSWIYVKSWNVSITRDVCSLSLSPCQFKMSEEDKGFQGESLKAVKQSSISFEVNRNAYVGTVDWSMHEEVIKALSYASSEQKGEVATRTDARNMLQRLLSAWFLAQCDAITSHTTAPVNSLILGKETLLVFKVKGYRLRATERVAGSTADSLTHRSEDRCSSVQILYLLSLTAESSSDGNVNGFELIFDEEKMRNGCIGCSGSLDKLKLGDHVVLFSAKEISSNQSQPSTTFSDSWKIIFPYITNRLTALLSPSSQVWFGAHNLPLPGHALIYGPPGSGKTSLAGAVAKYLKESKSILAHITFVSCSKLAMEKSPAIRQALSAYVSEAIDHAPSLVILDDLDSLLSSSSEPEGSQPSVSVVKLTEFLADIMDEYAIKRKTSCWIGPIVFLASVQSLENIPQSLSSSGRFDFHVQLSALAAPERGTILKHEIQKRFICCSDDLLADIASKCDGYDAYDLVILVDRAVHAAIGRFVTCSSASGEHKMPTLISEDFAKAMHDFLPVAMRDINKSPSLGGHSGWDIVGGLKDIRDAIREMIELPSRFPNIFAQTPLRLRSNVLLYGPPGCGKTHIVGAAAAACSLRFISIKGPELLNKYIGASEQAVRDIFSKAASAAPCLLFFDEFDSIAPKRGHDNTGVTDRVVNQFLTELDGVEALTGVFVFAATSRPDLLDAALLRPGRLDRLLFCDFPSPKERREILMVLSQQLPLVDDVDLESIAQVTDGFSGADLQALLSDAQLASVHELLDSTYHNESGKKPIITNALLRSVASKARPSVSEAEKQRLYGIYNQFLDSKRSVSEHLRDAKGKRSTLA